MAKPSIFSRDYEKKMKRRKRRITIGIILIFLVVVVAFVKFQLPNIDFTQVKAKIQAWVDTGKSVEQDEEVVDEEPIEEEKTQDVEKEPERTYIDFNIKEGTVAKAEYVEIEGVKKFVALEPIEGYTFSLSPSQQQMIVMDPNQNLYLLNVDGSLKDVTKKEYISTSKQTFSKDKMLAAYEGYIWHSIPSFIDENIIIYISQLPYFGAAATHKYIWIKDLTNNTDKTLWKTKGMDIQIGEVVPEKGITVTIDGNTKYINTAGVISQ